MRLRICNFWCGWFKIKHFLLEQVKTYLGYELFLCCRLQIEQTLSLAGVYRSEQSFSVSESSLSGSSVTSRPFLSRPNSLQAVVLVWWVASELCPHFSSHCPPCRGCAGEYNLTQSLGSSISHSSPVLKPSEPRWRSFHSSPIPSPEKCFDCGGKGCLTRAQPAQVEAHLDWRKRDQNARQPLPHGHLATDLGS